MQFDLVTDGLAFPEGLSGPGDSRFAATASGQELRIRVTARRRGLWPIDRFWLNWQSRLGLIEHSHRTALGLEIIVSPNIRIHRSLVSIGVWRNSDDRAYQVPTSTDAQACARPIGNVLSRTMAASPMLMDQNAMARGRSFHISPGRRARRQNSISPSPSMPYTPNRAVCPCTGVRFRPCT